MINQLDFRNCLTSSNKLKKYLNRAVPVILKYLISTYWRKFFTDLTLRISHVQTCLQWENKAILFERSAICCYITKKSFHCESSVKTVTLKVFQYEKLLYNLRKLLTLITSIFHFWKNFSFSQKLFLNKLKIFISDCSWSQTLTILNSFEFFKIIILVTNMFMFGTTLLISAQWWR